MTDKELLLIQMYSAQKKKKIIIIIVIIAIIILGLCVSAFIVISSQTVQLKQQSVTIEYGTVYTPKVTDFIDKENPRVEIELYPVSQYNITYDIIPK